jgi:phage-related protein
MRFRVRFYETVAGDKPLAEFLRSLETEHPVLHHLLNNGIKKLELRQHHRPPRTERVAGTEGLYELRVGRTDIARVFFFFRPGQEIVCTSGYVKKSQRLDSGEIERALRYQADWEARNP